MDSSQKNRLFKKMALKTDFRCESYALLKKDINGNKRVMWQVKDGPHGDAPPYLTMPKISLLNMLLMK
jgi:hypothetical protein